MDMNRRATFVECLSDVNLAEVLLSPDEQHPCTHIQEEWTSECVSSPVIKEFSLAAVSAATLGATCHICTSGTIEAGIRQSTMTTYNPLEVERSCVCVSVS